VRTPPKIHLFSGGVRIEKLHVLITAPLHEVEVERIAAVNSMVEVTYAMEEVRAELGITPESAIPLGRPMWQRELTRADASKALDSMLAHTEVMLSWRLPLNLLSRAPRILLLPHRTIRPGRKRGPAGS